MLGEGPARVLRESRSLTDCLSPSHEPYCIMGPSYRTSVSAIVAAALTIVYFIADKWLHIELPDSVLGAIGVLFGSALLSLGVNARDNKVTSEQVLQHRAQPAPIDRLSEPDTSSVASTGPR